MQTEWTGIYLQVLDQLEREIDAYESEDEMFRLLPGTPNSGGNLIIHLLGNIRHFYGAVLLGDGYERQRDHEFGGRMSVSEMKQQLAVSRDVIKRYFDEAGDDSFSDTYPIPFAGREVTCGFMYLQLLQHFTYHLGQINYHRRADS